MRGVGTIHFQLEFYEFLEVDGVLFNPWIRFSILSVSTLEDEGYEVGYRDGATLIHEVRVGA